LVLFQNSQQRHHIYSLPSTLYFLHETAFSQHEQCRMGQFGMEQHIMEQRRNGNITALWASKTVMRSIVGPQI
jgi:hypothetical protein